MHRNDTLVVGANEVGQVPVTLENLKAFLPKDHVFLELWPEISNLAILHPLQALNIVERFEDALKLPGDVCECGIFQGVTSILLAKMLDIHQSDKKLFLFDSFRGLPEPDQQVDASLRFNKGGWTATRDEVEARLAENDVLQRCIIHEGWFSETLPELHDDQEFCFAYIDADLYSSTVDCLKHLWQRLGKNSIAVFDDYHHPSGGVRKALDEWVSRTGELVHAGPVSQCFVIRSVTAENSNYEFHRLPIGNHKEITISFDHLRRNKIFCALLNARLENIRRSEEQLSQFADLIKEGKTSSN